MPNFRFDPYAATFVAGCPDAMAWFEGGRMWP